MCHKFTITGLCSVNGKLHYRKIAIPCNSWRCPECSARKARLLAIKARKGFEGCKVRFMTLTAGNQPTIAAQLKSLKTSWNRLRTELTRKGKPLKYFWVLEAGGKRGRPHLHILIDRYINQRRLSHLAARVGFGRVVDIRIVDNKGAFNYVTKYLSKGLGSVAVECVLRAQRGRRTGSSRGFAPRLEPKDKFYAIKFDEVVTPFKKEFSDFKQYEKVANVKVHVTQPKAWVLDCATEIKMDEEQAAHFVCGFRGGFLSIEDLDTEFLGISPDHFFPKWLRGVGFA